MTYIHATAIEAGTPTYEEACEMRDERLRASKVEGVDLARETYDDLIHRLRFQSLSSTELKQLTWAASVLDARLQ